LPTFLKIACKSVPKFLRKVANGQTNKQRRLHTSLMEVITNHKSHFRAILLHDNACCHITN